MRKITYILLIIIFLSGCKKSQEAVNTSILSLSVEQVSDYKLKIDKLLAKKLWKLDDKINYIKATLPNTVENTYYHEILKKSADSGYDFSKYLGKEIVEGIVQIKYNNADTAGEGHFLFYNNNLVGAYYMVDNYIHSLNEREVFKKNINWENVENLQKKYEFKEIQISSIQNLIYWAKNNDSETYLFSWDNHKLKMLYIDENQLILKNEIELKDLYLVSMFYNDIDKDKEAELGLLVSTNEKWWEQNSKNELLIYGLKDKLQRKYSLSFDKPMWSIDFDGKNIVVSSESTIEMYNLEDEIFKKSYVYNKVGGIIKLEDIDGSGNLRYILLDSKGSDVYVFQWNDGLEEIWRSYNQKNDSFKNIQTADLNQDGVKEIYLYGMNGNIRKLILGSGGFLTTNDNVLKGHNIFTGDFDDDGLYEYFDTYKKTPSSKTSITVLRH